MFVIFGENGWACGNTIEEAISDWESNTGDDFDPVDVTIVDGNEVFVKGETTYTVLLK